MAVRIVTAFTPDYADLAQRLIDSAKHFKVPVYPVPFESRGNWKLNCAFKPSAILQAMQETGDDCLWLDADMFLLSWPGRFADGDLLLKYSDPPEPTVFDFNKRTNVPNTHTKLTPWGGHLLWRNTLHSLTTINHWRQTCEKFGEITNDEQCLIPAIEYAEQYGMTIGPLNPSFIQHDPAGHKHGKPTAAEGWI